MTTTRYQNSPRPWKQWRTSTLFLQIPRTEWVDVTRGVKREFRSKRGSASLRHETSKLPTPVVGYRITADSEYESQMMVLEQMWREPLGSISPESLKAEGYEKFAEFRRYWIKRVREPFEPLLEVYVYRVRPWEPADVTHMGASLIRHLYQEHLP